MSLDKRTEFPRRHAVTAELRLRGDRRGARRLVEQRHLAEVVTRPEPSPLLAADGDLRLSAVDHEEADTRLPLGGDRFTRTERARLHRPGDALELALVEVGEDRYALQKIGCALCHGEDYATLRR